MPTDVKLSEETLERSRTYLTLVQAVLVEHKNDQAECANWDRVEWIENMVHKFCWLK